MAEAELRLSKHHGAGNDFLVLVDPDDRRPLSASEARALCDRHRGVGADGVLRAVTPSGSPRVDLAMELRNADGSVAEMSGNGIRCFVQAAVGAGLVRPGRVAVATLAGVRTVDYRQGDEPGLAHAGVDMGQARLGAEVSVDDIPGARAARLVDMGNPHVVVLGEPVDSALVAGAGPRLSARYPEGANVEFVWPGPDAGALTMRVWERGVGETLACGTGACAIAAATEAWGVTGRDVRVLSPGGVLEVTLGDAGIVLAGPTRHVADVTVGESTLAALVAARLETDDEVSARP
jgi:diaminopimelate epimerase